MPLTQFVKNAVKAMTIKQGFTCSKFTNKKGIKLGNSDWITGVDYDNLCKDQNNEESDGDANSTDEECAPELEQCKREDNSSDNDSCTNEDIKEEMDNLFDDDDKNGNDDTSNKDTDDKHNNDNDDAKNGNNSCTIPPQNEADAMEAEEEMMTIQPKLHQQPETENAKQRREKTQSTIGRNNQQSTKQFK